MKMLIEKSKGPWKKGRQIGFRRFVGGKFSGKKYAMTVESYFDEKNPGKTIDKYRVQNIQTGVYFPSLSKTPVSFEEAKIKFKKLEE